MSKFDFMGFSTGGGYDEMFVANAQKYTPEQVIEICKREYDWRFMETGVYRAKNERRCRFPTMKDVKKHACAFRFTDDPDYPDGWYTIVPVGERGSFLVWVIYLDELLTTEAHDEKTTD